jgi:hypothetical protein
MSRDKRGDGIQEVVGSIPIGSTKNTTSLNGGRQAAVGVLAGRITMMEAWVSDHSMQPSCDT